MSAEILTPWFDSLGRGAAAWALTYLVHSTLLLGAALIVGRFLARHCEFKDAMIKAALLGSLASATIASVAHYEPFGGLLHLGRALESHPSAACTSWVAPESIGISATLRSGSPPPAPVPPPPSVSTGPKAPPTPALESGEALLWGALALWFLGAAFGILRLLWGVFVLKRSLAGRQTVALGPLPEIARVLSRRSGFLKPPRLSWSARVPSPLALGRGEICVPLCVLKDLDREQQEALLAHELAHLRRGDPAWFRLALVLERLLFFQPLNRTARRSLQGTAELLADSFAVRATGDSLALASCLTQIAELSLRSPSPKIALAGMVSAGAGIVRRVERLLEERSPREAKRIEDWQRGVCATLLVAVALLAPSVSGRPSPAAATAACLASTSKLELSIERPKSQISARLASDGRVSVKVDRHLVPTEQLRRINQILEICGVDGSVRESLGILGDTGFFWAPRESDPKTYLNVKSEEGQTRITLLGGRSVAIETSLGHRLEELRNGLSIATATGQILLHLYERTTLPESLSFSAKEIGLSLRPPSEALASQLQISQEHALCADVVLKGGLAERAGLQRFDAITHVNGVKVQASQPRLPRLDSLALRVRRGRSLLNLQITLPSSIHRR